MLTTRTIDRRALLRSGLLGAGTLAFGSSLYRNAMAAALGPATAGPGPYGALGAYDANGIALPPGFTSRLIARGNQPVEGTAYTFPIFPDGGATFPTPDGGWILTRNSESSVATGGVSAIDFDRDGTITAARRVLGGTHLNCAGGPTPWGTWLSGEEFDDGQVWECDPTGTDAAVARPALGVFKHEAVCVDPVKEQLYLTEDVPDGCWYRFTPDAYPDLSAGLLEVATVAAGGAVTWTEVPNPAGGSATPTRNQVAGATRFNGGEGTWFDSGAVYFTTKGDKRVWAYDTRACTLEVLYAPETAGSGSALQSVDNVTVSRSGDIYVCEDGDNCEICLITPCREVAPFLRLDLDGAIHKPQFAALGNETTGVVFDPSGTRMYFGAQRSYSTTGAVYEISGPFRTAVVAPPAGSPDAGDGGRPPVVTTTPAGPAAEVARDRVAPGIRISVPKSVSAKSLLEKGVSVLVELDEPGGLTTYLRAPEGETIVKRSTPVAVRGRVRLRLKPSDDDARAMVRRRTKALRMHVTLDLRDRAGNRTIARRVVTLRPTPRKKARTRRRGK